MQVGLRKWKSASLRIGEPDIPAHMRPHMREVLDVKSENPRNGDATRLLYQVCAEADKAFTTLLLMPAAFDAGMNTEQLEKWYAKFGFERIQDEPVLMARQIVPPVRILH